MSKRYWFPRNRTHFQANNMISYVHGNQNNNHTENKESKMDQTVIKEESSLNEEMKNKCNISNEKIERGTMPAYHYNSNVILAKKNGEINQNSQDIFYPVLSFQESAQACGKTTFPPAEPDGYPHNWDGNPQTHYEQKPETPMYVYGVPVNYHGEHIPNYPQPTNTSNNQEMFKAWTPAQYDFPPSSNGGTFMKVYHWHSNTPNVFRPGGPPVPLKNIDIYANVSVAQDFSDLPLDDKETLRFFYNIGIQYFRLGSFIFSAPPPHAIDNSSNSDPGKPDKYFKKRDYCRKSHLSQKNYRTL